MQVVLGVGYYLISVFCDIVEGKVIVCVCYGIESKGFIEGLY